MKPFDIFAYQARNWPEVQPCVILSHPDRVATKPEVNVVLCSSHQTTRAAEAHEVILDKDDGLNWPTLCKCDLVRVVLKEQLKNRLGHVSDARRKQIIATINRANDWV